MRSNEASVKEHYVYQFFEGGDLSTNV